MHHTSLAHSLALHLKPVEFLLESCSKFLESVSMLFFAQARGDDLQSPSSQSEQELICQPLMHSSQPARHGPGFSLVHE